ncbi:Serine/threonine-protein kinase PknB [Symmachiella dynata]|uniref:protein kinase domain-containing protein n=1 Tax=Symmachiella dynata TaxID=2527995 RepID=UPI00118898C5|nr:protein kinase [Symmachiella dynata]QDT48061.1 Serine/threonine-protein kinase PknB [Symmachiella dynata]
MDNRWLWPFELKEKIGQGGMGVVYRARYVKNDREVAVKILPAEIAADKKIATRFERELEVLKKLKHPNIVYCFGGKCEGDQHFYAMELVEGGSLERLLKKRGRLPWEQVIEYTLQLCSALYFAHEHGFIHRDVKPGNLLLTNTGKLKLSDFGLARARSDVGLTEHGKTMGTFHYMSPEQIRGKPPLTGSADLYAMGCVMYEMMAGRPPFRGHSPAEILQKHLEKPAPPVSTNAMDCPAALEQIILDLLQKRVEDRPLSAIDVARRLKQVTQTTSLDATTRDITIRNTQAAQAVQEAMGTSERSFSGPGATRPSWSTTLAVIAVLLMALLFWNGYSSNSTQSAGKGGELWVEALKSSNSDVRIAAAKALGEIGPSAEGSVEALTLALSEDSNREVRRAAAESLGQIGAPAASAMRELDKVYQTDSEPQVRQEAEAASNAIRNSKKEDKSLGAWPFYLAGILVALAGIGAVVFSRIARTMRN